MAGLARVMSARGEHVRSVALQQEVIARLRQDGSRVRLALSLNDLAEAQELAGWTDDAKHSLEESVSLSRAINHTGALAVALAGLGHVARTAAPDDALPYYRESLRLFREMEQPDGIVRCLRGGASIVFARGDLAVAAKLLGAASATELQADVAGHRYELADAQLLEANCRRQLGSEAFSRWWQEGTTLGPISAADWALELW